LKDGKLTIVDCRSGRSAQSVALDGWNGLLASWSPDGKQVAYGSFGGANRVGLWILDVASGRKIMVAEGPLTMPAWSPDGTKFGFQAREEGGSGSVWMIDGKTLADLQSRLQAAPLPANGTSGSFR